MNRYALRPTVVQKIVTCRSEQRSVGELQASKTELSQMGVRNVVGPRWVLLQPASGISEGARHGKRMTSFSSVDEKINSTCIQAYCSYSNS